MKILTREQIQTKLKFAQKLTETGEDLQEVIARYNNLLSTATDEIQNLKGRFNEIVQEVQGFLGGIHDEQEAHMDKRTDRWRESDAGQAYQGWADAWGVDLEEVEITMPDEIEELSMDSVEVLRDLPDCP